MTEATPEPSAPKPAAPPAADIPATPSLLDESKVDPAPAITADDLKAIAVSIASKMIADNAMPGPETAADVFAEADAYYARMETSMTPFVLRSLKPNDAEFQAIAKQVSDLTTMAEVVVAAATGILTILKDAGLLAAMV